MPFQRNTSECTHNAHLLARPSQSERASQPGEPINKRPAIWSAGQSCGFLAADGIIANRCAPFHTLERPPMSWPVASQLDWPLRPLGRRRRRKRNDNYLNLLSFIPGPFILGQIISAARWLAAEARPARPRARRAELARRAALDGPVFARRPRGSGGARARRHFVTLCVHF